MERKYPLFVLSNKPCEECIKWQKFGKQCRVYWEGKKFCTLKVRTHEEWNEEKRILGL